MATISGKFVNDSGVVELEGSLVTEGPLDLTTPDVGATDNADSITIQAGSSDTPGTGTGGSVTIQAGDGDNKGETRINDGAGDTQVHVDDSGNVILGEFGGDVFVGAAVSAVGFYLHAPVAQQTGVAVSAAGIHAALVNLGLITA